MGSSLLYCSFCFYDTLVPLDDPFIRDRTERVAVVNGNSICQYHAQFSADGWLQTMQAIDAHYHSQEKAP